FTPPFAQRSAGFVSAPRTCLSRASLAASCCLRSQCRHRSNWALAKETSLRVCGTPGGGVQLLHRNQLPLRPAGRFRQAAALQPIAACPYVALFRSFTPPFAKRSAGFVSAPRNDLSRASLAAGCC